ncbi:ArsR/SmtB family transcription factor [Demequina sp. SO4-13]|uniref:ArsR/SmtB family transcription factor n=1 Tax=Demequina sp. SO4-13 TaxID=3401027 RepID=UPI003AF89B38
MAVPLHRAKAELFRTLGHPVRIRVLELLLDEPKQVRELLGEIDVESSNLSQQLAVLRRAGIVSSYREGANVMYRLSTPDVAELMGSARRILASMLTSQEDLLTELRAEMPAGSPSETPADPNQK